MSMRGPSRKLRLKNAVLASFYESAAEVAERLEEFSESDWRRALNWLDLSGLALYLLDRLTFLGLHGCLPTPILERLQRNLADNRERTAALFHEAVGIGRALKRNNISFALLKGVTLSPESVPEMALRCQMDIDILIRESDALAAGDIVMSFGYRLDCIKGLEWTFTAGTEKTMGIADIYKVRPQRMVELHLLPAADPTFARDDRLARARNRRFQHFELPALSPSDLFVQQALHIFKHLCSENTRALWLLEFWRHVLARRTNLAFWRRVESIAGAEPGADLAVGAVTLLTTLLFGPFAPEELSRWSMDRLSPEVRLWIETFGRRILLADFPGNKFYLLLRQQLNAGPSPPRVLGWRVLLPLHWWPTRITHGKAGERLYARLIRYRVETRYIWSRLRFHMETGLPYAIESWRWRHHQGDMTL